MAFEIRALTGTRLAQRYDVGELQRETDVGTQFRGEDVRTGGPINVDVVREGLGADSNASRTLEREAMTACEIRHPNVVTPCDIGALDDGSTFVITPRFTGETLEDRMCLSGSLPVGDVVRIGLDLLSALAAAHDLGILYLAATGYLPYTAPPPFALGEAVRGGTVRPPSTFPLELPGHFVRVLVQALQANAARRFGSARGMLYALEVARGAFALRNSGHARRAGLSHVAGSSFA